MQVLSIPADHYELQCYENPLKMSLKTQESIFQGPEYGYFIFKVYFSGHEFSMKSCQCRFMAHEIAMKYLPLGFMSPEKLVCYTFHGP